MSLVMNFIVRRFVMLFHFVVGLFRRALCCFRRRKRSLCDEDLVNIGIVSNGQVQTGETQGWASWEEPSSVVTEGDHSINHVEEQIRLYRQQRAKLQEVKEEEDQAPADDFFVEMTPRITKQTKVLLKNSNESQQNSNFSLAPDPVFSSSELGVWEESQSWEAQADENIDVNDVLREQKKRDRLRKAMEQQRRKENRQITATKVS